MIDPAIAHLLRRAGFGYTPAEGEYYSQRGLRVSIDQLVDFDRMPAVDVDDFLLNPDYLALESGDEEWNPNFHRWHARQRQLFRMVHSQRPLQEKMALFWHNHFATGYSKVEGQIGDAARTAFFAKPSEHARGVRGQYELFREYALGNFRDLLIEVSRDPAMVAWLDGDTNLRENPQENFARELMELFTLGVHSFTEGDVHAGARVFTGWNLDEHSVTDDYSDFDFLFRPEHHDTDSKTFSFPIYPDGGRTIPARAPATGEEDGLDLINALAAHPDTGPHLVRKLYRFFVSELKPPPESFIQELAGVYYSSGYDMRSVVRTLLHSTEFQDPDNYYTRYSWPLEHVVRLIKSLGWVGFPASWALDPLANMGQILYEPPNVAGWPYGPGWITTATLLERMNFAAELARNQQFNLEDRARPIVGDSPDELMLYLIDLMSPAEYDLEVLLRLRDYAARWSAWDRDRASGLAHLIGASPEYQFV